MPVAASRVSLTVVMLRSFICASVMTLVDCGVSLWESGRPVAERIHSVVQEPVSSVVVPGAAVTSSVSRTRAALALRLGLGRGGVLLLGLGPDRRPAPRRPSRRAHRRRAKQKRRPRRAGRCPNPAIDPVPCSDPDVLAGGGELHLRLPP